MDIVQRYLVKVIYLREFEIHDFRANLLMAFASIGVMFALISTPHTRENEKKRLGYFFLFCGISGEH